MFGGAVRWTAVSGYQLLLSLLNKLCFQFFKFWRKAIEFIVNRIESIQGIEHTVASSDWNQVVKLYRGTQRVLYSLTVRKVS